MALTPLQARQPDLPTALRGYDRDKTDAFLSKVAGDYEALWRERDALRKRLEELEGELAAHRDREANVAGALIAAESSAAQIAAAAEAEARAIVGEAESIQRRLEEEASHARERYAREAEQLRALADRIRRNLTDLLDETMRRVDDQTELLNELQAAVQERVAEDREQRAAESVEG